MFFLFLSSVDCPLTEVHTMFVSLILFLILTITIRYIIRYSTQLMSVDCLLTEIYYQDLGGHL